MTTEQHYFESGIPIESYMAQMESNQEKTYSIYEKFNLPEDPELTALVKEKQPHILAITEDWNGDAMMNNAILRKMAEATGIKVRCISRDANLELMDRYLTDGNRSIPKYLILSQDGEVLGTWGPRAPQVQQFVDEQKAKLPEQTDPQYEIHKKTIDGEISDGFTWNSDFWQIVYEDLRKAFKDSLK